MALPLYDHVVIVIEENHGFGQVIGSSSAPYINSLANGGALLTNYFADDHPSEPNYMIIYAGSDFGIGDDKFHAEPDPSLATKVQAAGKTFVGYVDSGSPEKHNPWEAFPEGTGVEKDFGSQFPTTSGGNFAALPNLAFVIPNLNHDMHDGTIQQADTWLRNNIDAYAQWAKTHNSLLIVTWDEDDSGGNNQVATIFYGANIVTGQYGATQYDHFNMCATLAALVGASPPRTTAAPIDGIYSATNVAPSVPTGLQTSSVTATSLTLSWTASTGSSPITYTVLDRVGGTGSFTTVASGISGTSRAISGLTSSTTYNFEVTATGPGGTSAPSAVLSATTLAASIAPSVPTGLQASNVASTSLTLSWTASTGTAPITYNVRDRITGTSTFSSVATGISGTSTAISGLTAGTSYDFDVIATGPGGTSAPSAALTVSTPTVTSAPSSPTGLQASNVATTSLTLSWNASIPPVKAITATGSGSTLNVSWTAPSAAPITYNVLDRITGTGNFSSAATGISGTSTTISGLTAGTSYDLEVVATSSDGTSAPSSVLTVSTASVTVAPSVPTGLRATSVSTTGLTLSWSASTGTGPITYNVLDRVTGSGSFTSVASGLSATSTSISGLSASTSYDFEVTAAGPGGTSAPSSALTVTTLATNVAPSVPTGLQASNVTTTSVALSWSASTGTGPITYSVQSRVSGTGSFSPVASGISGTSTTINGLTPNTNFDFEVIATGPGGTSAPSAVLTVTTLASGGAEVIYVLEESLASTGPWTAVAGSPFTTTADVVSGLSSGTGYFFRITAQDTVLGISSTPTIVGPIVTASNSGGGESPQNTRLSSPSVSAVPPVGAITATGSSSPSSVGITGLNLSNTTVPSGAASGTVVGQIAVQMSTGSFTGSLSLGGTNASLFGISGGNLVTASALAAGTYSITIIATQAGATNSPFTAPFSITAAANPVAITGVSLSSTTVPSGATSGTVVGQIAVQMSGGSFTGSLSLGGTNASLFRISGGNLVTASALAAGTYSITITATQAGATGSPFTAPFSITAAANPAPAGAVFFDDFNTLNLYNTRNTSSTVTVAPNVVSSPSALWQPGPWSGNRDGHQQNQTWLTNPFAPGTANFDLYKCSNSTVQLTCEPTPSQYSSAVGGAPLMGGYMTTFGHWQRRFGYWEAKLKVGPIVNGIGVEWWLWNTGSDNSEIDILESFDNFTSQTVHPGSGPSVYWNGFDGVVDPTIYHTWAADWQSGYVRLYHDNVKYVDTSPNGFGTEMFMFMTCDDFSDWNGSVDTGGPPVVNTVDYVVVYPTKP
jgi:chitodextrinase